MKPTVYIETTVISYLTARPSRNPIRAGHQDITRRWWRRRRQMFTPYVSQLVIDEAGRGDDTASAKRLRVISGMRKLVITPMATSIAKGLIEAKIVPQREPEDALHIGIAAAHGTDYLMTWNCKHIANAEIRNGLTAACRTYNCEPPVGCTPEELMGR